MIEIGEPTLLTKNVDGGDLGAAARVRASRRLESHSGRRARLTSRQEPEPLEDDPGEHDPANNPAGSSHSQGSGRVEQFDETSMP